MFQIRKNNEIIATEKTEAAAKHKVAGDISQSKYFARIGWLNAKQVHHLYTETRWSIYKDGRVVATYTANG
jgi:hypothetical protein